MTNLVLWCGPVSADALAGIVWQTPTQIVTIGQGIAGQTGGQFSAQAFTNLAAAARQAVPGGDLLDGLLALKKLPPSSSWDRIAVAAFSAGHALLNPLLLEDTGKIAAAMALDACYSDYNALAKPGYVTFGALAAKRARLMVYTASSGGGGPSFSTGSQCARASFNAALQLARVQGVALPDAALPTVPAPDATKTALWARAGDLFMLDYGSQLGHTQHAWQLAKPLFDAFLVPFLANGQLPQALAPSVGVVTLLPSNASPEVPVQVPPSPPSANPQDMPDEERVEAAPAPADEPTPFFTVPRVLGGLAVIAAAAVGVMAVKSAANAKTSRG